MNSRSTSPSAILRQPRATLRRPVPGGYTFIEILIVITIIGILVALLLPAVQAAREAARRCACGKNIEQLILAVHNYEMLHGVYPPGTVNATGPIQSLPVGYHHNWLVQLLPYLEEKNAFAHIDNEVGVYDPRNMPVRRMGISTLHCPSQAYSAIGYSDYAGVHNDVETPIDTDNNGTFFLNSRIRQADLIDGSSHTVFLGEKITLPGDLGWMSGTRATLRNMGIRINAAGGGWRARRSAPPLTGYPPGLEVPGFRTESLPKDAEQISELIGSGQSLNVRTKHRRVREPEDWNEFRGMAAGYDPYPSIQEIPASSSLPEKGSLVVGGFGSPHPGGGQFALGDGSVRYLSESLDVQLVLDLANRADQELSDDGYW